jgi:hypothetical protein
VTLPRRSHLPLHTTMFHILLFKGHNFFFTSNIQKFCIYSQTNDSLNRPNSFYQK